ncbi:MAG: Protease HtpX-like protein [Parcubacteria group bacterium GW2011_GWA2_38_13]|nr:MAG: Protease HtpX-like protein [Parcubacteria group bacterium GW2011_GWA2_38_13]
MYSQIDSNKRKTTLLIVIFIAVVMLAGWAFSVYSKSGYGSLAIAAIISTGMSLFGFYQGDKLALFTAGAKPLAQGENPYVSRMVENLCITSGIPMPKIYIMPDPAINAFATGRDPEHASIAVTLGAIEKLENEELEGVLAHELSHIKNYDIRLMMIVIVLVGILSLLGDWFLRFRFGGRGGRDKAGGQIGTILLIAGIVLLILSPIIGRLIQFAISRKREYLADASSALLTRYPEGLARALEKIKMENIPLDHANNATAHLYIANPFGGAKHLASKLFSTHPPIDDRIAELRKMA